jgi:hypothetical protein
VVLPAGVVQDTVRESNTAHTMERKRPNDLRAMLFLLCFAFWGSNATSVNGSQGSFRQAPLSLFSSDVKNVAHAEQ